MEGYAESIEEIAKIRKVKKDTPVTKNRDETLPEICWKTELAVRKHAAGFSCLGIELVQKKFKCYNR